MRNLQKDSRGVTLMELLVVIAIIGIMTVLTVPNIPVIIAKNRLRTANNDLMAKLRSIRALAISKGRALEFRLDLQAQSFEVWKQDYKEYNLLDEVKTADIDNEDLLTVLTDSGYQSDDEQPFILFEETEEILHVAPIWDPSTGAPIYQVPINYDIMASGGDHRNGIDTIEMEINGTPVDADKVGTIVFYPSGTVKDNITITLNGPSRYPGAYEIRVFKAGQIRGAT